MAKQAKTNRELLGTRVLTRYAELHSYLQQFAAGLYPFLWVMGRPGVGKTEAAQAAVRDRKVLYVKSARVSALALYLECYEHLNEPVVLDMDEMSDVLKDPDWRRLFLALGETTPAKALHWHSTTTRLGHTPTHFETASTLCVVSNEKPRQAAVWSRATVLEFSPTNREVHVAAARWFWDQEIYDWIGRHLDRLHPLDMRWYHEAYSDRLAGRDWQDLLLRYYALNHAETLVQDLENDPAHPTRRDKERRFVEIMAGQKGGSRANYHLIVARLRKTGRLELAEGLEGGGLSAPIQVRGKRPPSPEGLTQAAPPPADIPRRDAFRQTVTGAGEPVRTRREEADDTVGWERPPQDDED
jgi:hypothetical protein